MEEGIPTGRKPCIFLVVILMFICVMAFTICLMSLPGIEQTPHAVLIRGLEPSPGLM